MLEVRSESIATNRILLGDEDGRPTADPPRTTRGAAMESFMLLIIKRYAREL